MGSLAIMATKLYLIINTLLIRDQKRFGIRLQSAPDLATLLVPPVIELKDPSAMNKIICSFRNDRGDQEEQKVLLNKWITLVRDLMDATGLPVSICYQVERDKLPCEELSHGLGLDPEQVIQVSIENFKEIYTCDSFTVSNRMHVALTALCLGGCGVAVENEKRDGKIVGAFSEMGIANYVLTHEICGSGGLANLTSTWIEDRESVQNILKDSRARLVSTIAECLNLV